MRFKTRFQKDILPLYKAHENSFDTIGLHGRRHISRAVFWAEWMLRFYTRHLLIPLDVEAVRYAVAFHDAGRQGNGKDIWEADSAQLCYNYLIKLGKDTKYAHSVANLIVHKEKDLGQIVQDADVLEYMRMLCNEQEGIKNFKKEKLQFLSPQDCHLNDDSFAIQYNPTYLITYREKMIASAWEVIYQSETLPDNFWHTQDYLGDLITYQTIFDADFRDVWTA